MDAVTKVPLVVLALILLPAARALAAPVIEADICVYGGTSGGVIAAVQAARQGKSVAFAVFGTRIGGMTTGGLGATDVGGNGTAYIQGLSRDFCHRRHRAALQRRRAEVHLRAKGRYVRLQ